MTRENLIEELKAYRGLDVEMRDAPQMIELLQNNPDCFWRHDFNPGHITGSAILLNQAGDKILLNRHAIYNRWETLGGHADGEEDVRSVAMREAYEESGIAEEHIAFVTPDIFDLSVHFIAANAAKKEPEHYHFDLVFLFRSATEDFIISEESKELKWSGFDEAEKLVRAEGDPRMLRVISKWKNSFDVR